MTTMTLRERLRAGVKRELRDVAFRLFKQHGFDEVSINEITLAAGVSQRTFFRYFATKEDVILEGLDDTSPMIREALRTAPVSLSPLEALRRAFLSPQQTAPDTASNVLALKLALDSVRLRAALNERRRLWEASLVMEIALRLGVSPDEDVRPTVWAASVSAAVVAVHERALRLDNDMAPRNPYPAVQETFDALQTLAAEPVRE